MDELITKLQRRLEADLEYFLPEHTSPYFDRRQLVAGMLSAAHVYALEVTNLLVDRVMRSHSMGVAVVKACTKCSGGMPECPECGGTGTTMVCGLHGQCPSCGHGELKHG